MMDKKELFSKNQQLSTEFDRENNQPVVYVKVDELVKSQKMSFSVIPAKAGIQ